MLSLNYVRLRGPNARVRAGHVVSFFGSTLDQSCRGSWKPIFWRRRGAYRIRKVGWKGEGYGMGRRDI